MLSIWFGMSEHPNERIADNDASESFIWWSHKVRSLLKMLMAFQLNVLLLGKLICPTINQVAAANRNTKECTGIAVEIGKMRTLPVRMDF